MINTHGVVIIKLLQIWLPVINGQPLFLRFFRKLLLHLAEDSINCNNQK